VYFLYKILFTNAHGMDFQMKMTQPYTQFCSSLYVGEPVMVELSGLVSRERAHEVSFQVSRIKPYRFSMPNASARPSTSRNSPPLPTDPPTELLKFRPIEKEQCRQVQVDAKSSGTHSLLSPALLRGTMHRCSRFSQLFFC
jgi:hypothetical protein